MQIFNGHNDNPSCWELPQTSTLHKRTFSTTWWSTCNIDIGKVLPGLENSDEHFTIRVFFAKISNFWSFFCVSQTMPTDMCALQDFDEPDKLYIQVNDVITIIEGRWVCSSLWTRGPPNVTPPTCQDSLTFSQPSAFLGQRTTGGGVKTNGPWRLDSSPETWWHRLRVYRRTTSAGRSRTASSTRDTETRTPIAAGASPTGLMSKDKLLFNLF